MAKQKQKWKLTKGRVIRIFTSLVILLLWGWMLYITQPATENNTHIIEVAIREVEIRDISASRAGNVVLVLHHEDGFYFLDPLDGNAEGIAEHLRSLNGAVTLAVWEHIPNHLFVPARTFGWCEQAVSVTCGTKTLYSLSEHNDYQRGERIAGILLMVVVTLLTVVVLVIWAMVDMDIPIGHSLSRGHRKGFKKGKMRK